MPKLTYVDKKVIVSGGMVEEWNYEIPPVRGGIPKQKRGHSDAQQKKKWTDKNRKEAFHNFVRLVCSNFADKRSRFITLTFQENLTNIAVANQHFENFIKWLRRDYGTEFRYLVTTEFQKRGAVHFHVISDIGYVKAPELAKIWGHGQIDVKLIQNAKHAAIYAAKYMKKGIDERLSGKKSYWGSKNLLKPKEILNQKAEDFLNSHQDREIYTEKSYLSEYNGQVVYRKFFLNLEQTSLK
jgi:hypothetical protein